MIKNRIKVEPRSPFTFLVSILVTISLLGFSMPVSWAGGAKPGSSCSKIGKVHTIKGLRLTCVKVGKRLIWDKGVRTSTKTSSTSPTAKNPINVPNPIATPAVISTPSSPQLDSITATATDSPTVATSSPTPTPSPTTTQAPVKVASTVPQIGKAGGYIYRYLNGKQERQHDDGEWYSADQRADSTFDPIRVAAYKSINALTPDESHQRISFTYVIRDSYPKDISSTIRYQVEKVAKVFSNSLDQNLPITVYMVTEQDRKYINEELPSLIPGFSPYSMSILDDYVSLQRFYSRGGTGGGQAGYIDQQGRGFYLANTSSLAELDTYWPEVPPHEMAHVFQFFFARGSSGGNGEGNPDSKWHGHLIEGSANTIGMALGFETLGWYHDEMDKLLQRTIKNQSFKMNTEADAVTLINEIQKRDTELRNEFSYAAGQIVWEYFIGKYGIEKYIELLKNVPRTENFNLNLQATIGKSREAFYEEAGVYLFATWKRLSP